MHSSASCASCIAGVAKKHSLVATSGRLRASASAISPPSTARSTASPCRCSSTATRPPNASSIRASMAAASASRPSASSRASGPRVPPVSSIIPSACAATVSNTSCGSAGSDVRNPAEDRRCRLASPASVCASSTTGAPIARERDLAPDDRLHAAPGAVLRELQRAEQIGGVGDGHRRHAGLARQRGDLLRLDGAFAERIGGVDSEVDEAGHCGNLGGEEEGKQSFFEKKDQKTCAFWALGCGRFRGVLTGGGGGSMGSAGRSTAERPG